MTPNTASKSRDSSPGPITNYLDNLPPDVAYRIAMRRFVGSAEAAEVLNFSLGHFRKLYRAGKVPPPIKLSERKLAWRMGDLLSFRDGNGVEAVS